MTRSPIETSILNLKGSLGPDNDDDDDDDDDAADDHDDHNTPE